MRTDEKRCGILAEAAAIGMLPRRHGTILGAIRLLPL